MKTLLRSWFFRLFTGGAILGLGIFNVALNVESSGAPWMYKAIAASIPYANLIILNLGQAIVAVFLSSEFLKQDRKNDTIEVIYARSMTNGQYVLGKTLGILAVFLVLNIIILFMGVAFSFISNTTTQSVFAYLTYPLLISLPTLVFILGFSFFVMTLFKNQAVTFILLTGYIALTIFYLNKKAFHILDYIAYKVPMVYSSITGFARFDEIVQHRCIYLLLGIGLILLTVHKFQRLPQSHGMHKTSLYLGLVFLCAGGFLVYRYLDLKMSSRETRLQAIGLNNRYAGSMKPAITSCSLDLEHYGNTIFVNARLSVQNKNTRKLDTLLFSLNPGLAVNQVTMDDQELKYDKILHLLRIVPVEPLQAGNTCTLQITYSGKVDEKICFLDKDPASFQEIFNFEVFTMRKRFAFLQKNFVCLTSESLWYPVSGTTYTTIAPMSVEPDFATYTLRVKTSPELTALSQGKVIRAGDGIFEFRPEYPLPAITLLIGDYVQYKTVVDSVEYVLCTIRDHDYFRPVFDRIADTIPALIRELKKDYEVYTGLTYPFPRLIIAEVPLHFALDIHLYSFASDAVQPEMILYPEKGVLLSASDFRYGKYRINRELKNNNEEASPEEIQSRLFKQFFRENFLAKRGQDFNYREVVGWETFSLFPEYLRYYTQLESKHWSVLNLAFETYMYEKNNQEATMLRWYQDLSQDEKISIELGNSSLEELLVRGSVNAKDDGKVSIRDIAQAKGLQLFNMLKAKHGDAEVDSLFSGLVSDYPHREIPMDELNARFQKRFHIDLEKEIQDWYIQKSLPGFIIKNVNTYKVMDGEQSRFQIRFNLSNPETSDGIVTLNVELNDPNRNQDNFFQDNFNVDFSRKIFLPARTSRDVGFVFNTEPARMSVVTHISKNLPSNLIFGFSGFNETKKVPVVDGVYAMPFFERVTKDNEIVTDNEDPEFSFEQATNQAYLKSLVNKHREAGYEYSAIWSWNPPREWKAVLRSEFYGNYIHSAYYTRGGTGERTATWKTVLPEKATYDIYFYLDKVHVGWRRSNRSSDYNFVIYHNNGIERLTRSSEDAENGWNYLGTFSLSADTARIDLTNKTVGGDMIFADAVKWVINR
jgi:ABC-type transport system involved in multi-copper enzyme maturation permease subunit